MNILAAEEEAFDLRYRRRVKSSRGLVSPAAHLRSPGSRCSRGRGCSRRCVGVRAVLVVQAGFGLFLMGVRFLHGLIVEVRFDLFQTGVRFVMGVQVGSDFFLSMWVFI